MFTRRWKKMEISRWWRTRLSNCNKNLYIWRKKSSSHKKETIFKWNEHTEKSHYCCHCWQMIKRTLTRHQAALAICCFILFLLLTKQQLLYVSIKFQFLWFPLRFFFSPSTEMDVDDANGGKRISVETSWQNPIVYFSLFHSIVCNLYLWM